MQAKYLHIESTKVIIQKVRRENIERSELDGKRVE